MQEFHKAVEASKIPDSGLLSVEVDGESVLIAKVGDKYFAMGAICNHQQWDLSEGTLDGTKVTCAGHGSVWDLRTGKAEFDEPLEDEPLYDVKLENGTIFISKR
jgi:nitrite reductase/ring-hydroxylating ferredoxin subunit